MPKVSVLTPLYRTNHDHLREMMNSVLQQTYKDFEFILLNDSPDDESLRGIIRTYSDPRIRYLENEKNIGISGSRNRLIDEAVGEYLAVLDHDDVCLPNRLADQVDFMEKHPEIGLLSGFVELMSTGKAYPERHPETNLEIKARLLSENCLAHSAMMIRSSVMKKNRIYYSSMMSPAEDYDLCIRLIPFTLFHNLQKTLIRYRDTYENTTKKQKDLMEDKKALIRSFAIKEYSSYGTSSRKAWSLFGFFTVLTSRKIRAGELYLLFGIIPFILKKIK